MILFDGRFPAANQGAWDEVHTDKPGNTSTVRYITSPRRRTSGYAAEITVQGPAGTPERVQYRQTPVIKPEAGQSGKEWWIADSIYLPSGFALYHYTNFIDFDTKFNSSCSASIISGNGAICPELYVANSAGDRLGPVDQWRVKIGGAFTPSCAVKYYTVPGLAVPRDKWIDWLWHFRWSPTGPGRWSPWPATDPRSQPITEMWFRVAPATTWTQAFIDTATPNLVRSSTVDADPNIHAGLYKDESLTDPSRVIRGGIVVASTRAEAETAAF